MRKLVFLIRVALTRFLTFWLEVAFRSRIGPGARLVEALGRRPPLPGATARVLAPPAPMPRCEPRSFEDGIREQAYRAQLKAEGDEESLPAGIITARDVDVSIPFGTHLWGGRVFRDSILRSDVLVNPKYVLDLETIPLRRRRFIPEGVLLTLPWHHNFCHWMIDILPRLLLLDRAEDLRGVPLLVPKSSPRFVRESLELTGYLGQALFLDRGVYRVGRMHLLSRLTEVPDVSPLAIDWLNRKFPQTPPGRRRRVYVSRADAKMRFVVNEAEVQKVMSEFGFETLVTSGLSLLDQIRLFRDAEAVVGAHGAAFSLLSFVDPGSTFIELFDSHYCNRCFHRMAGVKRLKYGFILGRPKGFGFVLDPDRLRIHLRQLFRPESPAERRRDAMIASPHAGSGAGASPG